MTTSVFIDGAAGTTGLEIRERLENRNEFSLVTLADGRRKDAAARRYALNSCDVAILCLPDDAAREAVALIDNPGTAVIDASSAHRVADGWTYGFPELVGRETVAASKRIANPGCYPTGFLALIAPLIRAGLLPTNWPYTVNAVSGYSGGGRALIERFEQDRTIAWRGYGLALGHKHVPEMQFYASLDHPPLFAPAVIDAHRGMAVEVPLPLVAMDTGATAAELHAALAAFYDGSAIVSVAPFGLTPAELLLHKGAASWDSLDLHVLADPDGAHLRLIALLDNLGKGASGAAVQSLNLIAGLPEKTGLNLSA